MDTYTYHAHYKIDLIFILTMAMKCYDKFIWLRIAGIRISRLVTKKIINNYTVKNIRNYPLQKQIYKF